MQQQSSSDVELLDEGGSNGVDAEEAELSVEGGSNDEDADRFILGFAFPPFFACSTALATISWTSLSYADVYVTVIPLSVQTSL
jgi:hypothetical protein